MNDQDPGYKDYNDHRLQPDETWICEKCGVEVEPEKPCCLPCQEAEAAVGYANTIGSMVDSLFGFDKD